MATLFTNVDNVTLDNNAAGAVEVKDASLTQAKMDILNPLNAGPVSNSTTSSTYVSTGLSRAMTTTGGAVLIIFSGNGYIGQNGSTGTQEVDFEITRTGGGTVQICSFEWHEMFAGDYRLPPGCLCAIDTTVAGLPGGYQYNLNYAAVIAGTTAIVSGITMTVIEL